ncbi:MAG TPA: heparan-alpha-glucosaminide N-acetyltransferase domain-containing protein [Steroidobacteraceae bacterium]|nr:heparan-alpha-glucosaminide N-acetyltransferase domain-containing protein [Steroidobacteraceae bacterium]
MQFEVAITRAATSDKAAGVARQTTRIAAIDWMRGLVMILMTIDHASMAFDGSHVSHDSAYYADAMTMALPAGEFFTRWITHLCAPTFVFLAGTALALSIERRVAKGAKPWDIDKNILKRGAIIALFDLTIISLGSGYLNLGVLLAIGLSMICMAFLRRLPTWALLALAFGWIAFGEFFTGLTWHPPGSAPPLTSFFMATGTAPPLTSLFTDVGAPGGVVNKYSLFPWLTMMVLGWVFGRHMLQWDAGKTRLSPITLLTIAGAVALVVFAVVRAQQGYGDMFLNRVDDSWQQWLHVSKYPPSLTFYALELGILWLCLALLMKIEPIIGVRPNGAFLLFGQTAMFFYLVHRLVLEVPATYFGLRGVGDLATTYIVSAILLVLLYPACLWYRTFKAAHPNSFLKYI